MSLKSTVIEPPFSSFFALIAAKWHIVSDTPDNQNAPIGVTKQVLDAANAPSSQPSSKGQQSRRGMRLPKPFNTLWSDGTAVFNDAANMLWDNNDYNLVSGVCPQVFLGPDFAAFNRLAWADCTASDYEVEFLSSLQEFMQVRIVVP